jgi:hypothetical protein
MDLSTTRPNEQWAVSEPAYRNFHRACLAACIVLAPLVLFLGFAFDPTGGVGVPSSVNILAAEFKAASPLQVQLFLYFNAVTVYFFPLSFIGLGLLAMRRSPWLATIGMICGLAGSLPFAVFVGPEAIAASLGQLGVSAAAAAVWQYVNSQGAFLLLGGSWVIGHLLGYVITGIALIRSRAIPLWAASLFIVGIPFQMISYPTRLGILQLICFALIFIGSIPAALSMLRRSGEEAPLPAGEEAAVRSTS